MYTYVIEHLKGMGYLSALHILLKKSFRRRIIQENWYLIFAGMLDIIIFDAREVLVRTWLIILVKDEFRK